MPTAVFLGTVVSPNCSMLLGLSGSVIFTQPLFMSKMPNSLPMGAIFNYDTIKGSEEIFLVPSKDFINEELFSKSIQHSRTDNSCYSMRGSTKKNKESLKRYQFESFEKLNKFLEI